MTIRCDKCNKKFDPSGQTWDMISVEKYRRILREHNYEQLCEDCTFELSKLTLLTGESK